MTLAGVDHVIRLGVAGGVAAIVTEADAFEELSELPRLGLGQNDGDLDGFLIMIPVSLDVAATRIDLGLDAPGEAPVLEEASQLQGTVELI